MQILQVRIVNLKWENETDSSEGSVDETTVEDIAGEHIDQNTENNVTDECQWHEVTTKPRGIAFQVHETLHLRASLSYNNKVWPIDVFQQIFTDSNVNMIVEETNWYAEQVIGSNIVTRKSRLKVWSSTNADEMKKFFGLVMYMGLVPLPEIHLYWSKSCLYCNVFVEQTMARDRFFLLLRMAHFCNNADADNDRRDFKVHQLKTFNYYILQVSRL